MCNSRLQVGAGTRISGTRLDTNRGRPLSEVASQGPDAVTPGESASELAGRLSRASIKKFWNVYAAIDWPDGVEPEAEWFMSPELVSIYGTETWERLDDKARRRLSFWELVNFFSLTLQGERPLVQGLCNQMYSRQDAPITNYIHHFLDEENKHMVMFAEFCNRYAGKVYAQKKIALPKRYAKGEEDVTFFIKALVVEELGDYYNVVMMRDERIAPIAREVNRIHHEDEARHIVFGRRLLGELWKRHAPRWPAETVEGLRLWLGEYLRSSWGDFYNPSMYRDAGLEDSYALREASLASPICRAHRERASRKLVDVFLKTGVLAEDPAL
jgi:hypothetical protein